MASTMAARDAVPMVGEQRLEAEHSHTARPMERTSERAKQQDAMFAEALSSREQFDVRTFRLGQQKIRAPSQSLQRIGPESSSLESFLANALYMVQPGNVGTRSMLFGDPRRDLSTWIGEIPPQGVYEDARRQWMTNTCTWLEDRETYRDWIRDESGSACSKYLWLCGDAGFGKTVTCAWVVDQAELAGNKVVHFFFTSRKPATQQTSAVLRSWLTQIIYKDDAARAVASEIRARKPSPSATTEDLWFILERILNFDPACILVIDGLDECGSKDSEVTYQVGDARTQFLQRLLQVTAEKGCRVLLTSRRFNEIDILWQNGAATSQGNSLTKYEISSSDTDPDISLLARSVIDRLAEFPEDVRSELSIQISKRAKGMFLMVRLNENQLSPAHTEQEVKDIIEDTPPDLENVFKRELQRIYVQEKRLRGRAISILRWTLCAQRPLTTSQLSEALVVDATEIGTGSFPEKNLNKINRPYVTLRIQGLCGSLIRIVEGKSGTDLAHQTVQFSHASIGEYLAGRSYSTMPSDTDIGSLEGFLDHDALVQVCLRYLLYDDFAGGRHMSRYDVLQLLRRRPFLGYAAMHWPDHLLQCTSDSPRARELIEALFHPKNRQWTTWAYVYEYHDRVLSKRKKPPAWPPSPSPLYYAALLGNSRLVNFLLSQGVKVDTDGGRYGNALAAAAYHGQEDIVETLLTEGADVNARGGIYTTALVAAAAAAAQHPCSIRIIKMLLKSGADISTIDRGERSALHHAALAGSLPIVQKLIRKWKKRNAARPVTELLNMVDIAGSTALILSASKADISMVKCLLDHGADIEIGDNAESTPLFEAIKRGHEDIVHLLLRSGADVHWSTKDGSTTLYIASIRGHAEIAQLLIDKQVDVGARTKDRETALFAAAIEGHEKVVRLLAKHGADVHARTKWDHRTILFAASERGHRDVVQFLLAQKVDVNATLPDGRTALLSAIRYGHPQVARLLIDHGADVQAKKRNGATLLHQVSREDVESVECIEIALSSAVPIDAITDDGCTALFDALRNGQTKWARRLIERGASLNRITETGATMLHGLCIGPKDEEELGKIFLAANVDVNATMTNGCTALFYASNRGHLRLAKLLIAHHANPDLAYSDGATPIHIASQEGRLAIVQALLDANARVDARRLDGASSLFLAVASGHRMVAQLLIENGASVDSRIKNGPTILDIACESADDDDELMSNLLLANGGTNVSTAEGLLFLEKAIIARNERVAGLLIHKGATSRLMTDGDVWTIKAPFISGNEDIAQLFLEDGIDADTVTATGTNLLFNAALGGHERIVQLLLRHGVDVHKNQANGNTPLYAACQEGHLEIVRILLDQGVDINARREDIGWTPLMAAAMDGHRGVIRLLLERKADPYITGDDGITAMHLISQCSIECTDIVELLSSYPGLTDAMTLERRNPLFDAALNGHQKIVRFLLDNGADPYAITSLGSTAVHAAARNGHQLILRVLLDKGLDINKMRLMRETPIVEAAIAAQIDIVRLLLERYANIFLSRDDGYSVLHAICELPSEEVELVEILLERGIDIELETDTGYTPLLTAAIKGHKQIVQLLINRGADINTITNDGLTLLYVACEHGHEDLVRLLLSKSTSHIEDSSREGSTPLIAASHNGHAAVMKLLIDAGADVRASTKDGVTPLHEAALVGSKRAIELLLSKDVDINAKMNLGRTALSIAAYNGNDAIVRLLLEKGADVQVLEDDEINLLHLICSNDTENVPLLELALSYGLNKDAVSANGRTPCFAAALRGHERLVRTLIQSGADVQTAEATGGTPLHAACQKGDIQIVSLLLDHYPDINVSDQSNYTPVLLAALNGHKDIVRLLLERDADPYVVATNGTTMLHAVCKSKIGRLDLLKQLLLSTNISKDAETISKSTPLFLAALNGHSELVEFLIEAEADLSKMTDEGATPLYAAAFNGNYQMVQLLFEKELSLKHASTTDTAANGQSTAGDSSVEKSSPETFATNYGCTLLHGACLANDENVPLARFILEKGVDINAVTEKGETALMIAARRGFEKIALLLLERGASVETASGRTALFAACESIDQRTLVVEKILEKTERIILEPDLGRTPLYQAALSGHKMIVQQLLKKGADVQAPCNNGRTALGAACQNGHLGIVRLLLGHGALIEATDEEGWTALEFAIEKGERQTVQILLDYGACLEHPRAQGRTYLNSAVIWNQQAVVRTLISAGTPLNLVDRNGETALHCAVGCNNYQLTRMLLSYPCASQIIDRMSDFEETALYLASSNGDRKIVNLILSHKPQLDLACRRGMTALQNAIDRERIEIANDLLDAGADVRTRTSKGLTTLLIACQAGNVELVDRLIDLADVDEVDCRGKSGLHYALKDGHLAIAQKLIKRGHSPHIKTTGGHDVVYFAAKSGNVSCLEYLLSLELSFENLTGKGRLPVHTAAKDRRIDALQWLADHGSSVDVPDYLDMRPLHLAAQFGNLAAVELLLRLNADVDAKTRKGLMPLYFAAYHGHLDIVKALLTHSANLDGQESAEMTILHAAAIGPDPDVAYFLLERGLDPLKVTAKGWTILHSAAGGGHFDLAKHLVDKGVDPLAKNTDKTSALHFAARSGSEELVDWLIDCGADVTAEDDHGMTPVAAAASEGYVEIIKRLVAKEADLHARNRVGRGIQHYAALFGQLETLEYLASQGVDMNCGSIAKTTPLHIAARRGNIPIIRYLLQEQQVDPNPASITGMTPLHEAVYKCDILAARELLKHGANPNLLDGFGRSCLDWTSHNPPIFNSLLREGDSYTPTPKSRSQAITLASLQEYLQRTEPKISFHTLGHFLMFQDDIYGAEIAFERDMKITPGRDDPLHTAYCNVCGPRVQIRGPRFVCRSCPDTDLCSGCMEGYRTYGFPYMLCRGHEFLEVPGKAWKDRAEGMFDDFGHTEETWIESLRERFKAEAVEVASLPQR